MNWKERFVNDIYGEDDALFDRAGNNVSAQVENLVDSLLQNQLKRIEGKVTKEWNACYEDGRFFTLKSVIQIINQEKSL